ncbi:MAG: hypothetical protein U9P63_03190 [Patescibacteria group bacterium]|nr:hypothetical protein [Patescibacteria group bacterium]
MRYFIILIIFIFSFGIASAQGQGSETFIGWADLIYKKINNSAREVLDLVKQNTDIIPEKTENKAEEIFEDAQETVIKKAEEAKVEIKQEIKEQVKKGAKKVFLGAVKSVENKIFNPLKIKIREGMGLVGEFAGQLKDYLINWLKE